MIKKTYTILLGVCLLLQSTGLIAQATGDKLDTWDYGKLSSKVWLDGLNTPWSLAFIDSNHALITEIGGSLWQVIDGSRTSEPVKNTPVVHTGGQGGLLAVAIDPDYKKNKWVYIAYSHALASGFPSKAMTRIERAQIIDNTWTNSEVLFTAKSEHYSSSGQHFGSRIVFDKQGYLYFTVGDRGKRKLAQSLDTPNGKIHRIHKDGAIPKDNPYLNSAYPSIYTYGNRNPQGLAMHPVTGQIWSAEHGPRGGDELNVIRKGANYGWPEISYGINYIGTELTPYVRKEGMQQPAYYWRPSIAVSNIRFYSGDLFKKWSNKLLVGALKYQQVTVLDIEADRVMHEELIYKNAGRVRDIVVGPKGAIYVVLNAPGRVVKLTP